MLNEYVDRILRCYLPGILRTDSVAVPDEEVEMNWRLFFAHSQDMQGFRADIFVGGPSEARNPHDTCFVGLRERWGDSRSLIAALGSLWEDEATRKELICISNPMRPREERQRGIQPALDLLLAWGTEPIREFAGALMDLRGPKVARKTNMMIRAYAQNSYLLMRHDCGFRTYLRSVVPGPPFPPDGDVTEAERVWIAALSRDFYGVGGTLAPYLICDWLLWLWREGQIDWFESYKPDSVHLAAVKEGLPPEAAARDFVAYCKTIPIPQGIGRLTGKPCPPRVLNECIWLDRNRSSGSR
jgi:hypothetical protein